MNPAQSPHNTVLNFLCLHQHGDQMHYVFGHFSIGAFWSMMNASSFVNKRSKYKVTAGSSMLESALFGPVNVVP